MSETDSGSAVRRMGMGSVWGLKSLEGWALAGAAGRGAGAGEAMRRRREKSSGSASGRETMRWGVGWCLRGETGEAREVEVGVGGFGDFSGRDAEGDGGGWGRSARSLGREALREMCELDE